MTTQTTSAPLAQPEPFTGVRGHTRLVVTGVRAAVADHVTSLAQAIAYGLFLAIPSALLVGLGAFSLLAGQNTIDSLMSRLSAVMPAEALDLLRSSLNRMLEQQNGSVAMIVLGVVLALWSLSGAMQTVMWALNIAYRREETRGMVRQRLVALQMVLCIAAALTLVLVLLVLGPALSDWASQAAGTDLTWVWWTLQWPLLVAGLTLCLATILHLAPDRPARWICISPGVIVTVVIWIAASAAFAVFASRFGSYNKAWGSLSAVIVTLVWLWIASLALLIGGEIEAEAARARDRDG